MKKYHFKSTTVHEKHPMKSNVQKKTKKKEQETEENLNVGGMTQLNNSMTS